MRKMKKTTLDWVEQIPAEWEIKKLKYCFAFGKGLSITKDNLEESGISVISYGQIHSKQNKGTAVHESLIRFVNESYLRTDISALVRKNDFIFADTSEDLEGCGNCVYNDYDGKLFAGYHTIIFRSQQPDAKYFAYLFLTDCWRSQIRKVASGVKLYSITQKILKETSIIIPPIPEQKRIADFLDAKCSDIDQIRADIEKQIEILTDYKQSVITEAVTKGLEPKVKLKDSGIKWVGKIPEHWTLTKIGSVYSLRSEKVSDKVFAPLSVTKNGVLPQLESVAKTDDGDNRKLVRKGDFVINSRSDRRGSCGISYLDGSVSLINTVLKPRNEMNPKYYNWLFHTDLFADEFYSWGHGIVDDLWTTRWQEMKNILIPVPPSAEQKNIAAYLDEKCSEIDATIAEKQKQLETLEEYKKSLIFEYVTGKKEVV